MALRFLLIYLFLCEIRPENIMGPFVFDLERTRHCDSPAEIYGGDHPNGFVEIYEEQGKKLMKWNYTMPITDGPFQVHLTGWALKNDKYVQVYDSEGSACKNIVFRVLFQMANVSPQGKNCRLKKGFYQGDGIDVNEIIHILSRVIAYGSFKIRTILTVSSGVLMCREIYGSAKPIVDNE